eukprot:scaffold107552_cov46-Prasinocladus_malaysianus.AAC.4
MLHIAVKAGGDATHLDVVLQLLSNPRCLQLELYQGRPLAAMRCHGKSAKDVLYGPDLDEHDRSGMKKLFNPTVENLQQLLREGKDTQMAASAFTEFLTSLVPPDSGDSTFLSNSSASASEAGQPIDVASLLDGRYEDGASILMVAAKLSSEELVAAILDVCEIFESDSEKLNNENGGRGAQMDYLSQHVSNDFLEPQNGFARCMQTGSLNAPDDMPVIGSDGKFIEDEEKIHEWLKAQPQLLDGWTEYGKVSVIDRNGNEVGAFAGELLSVKDWTERLKHPTRAKYAERNQGQKPFKLRRRVVNR